MLVLNEIQFKDAYPETQLAVVKMNLVDIRTPPQNVWEDVPDIRIPTADG